jgi:hypothetical protein
MSALTAPSTCNAHEFWVAESKRLGSDWISIAAVVTGIMRELARRSS